MTLAIIGGSGLTELDGLVISEKKTLITPYGEPSADFVVGSLNGQKIIFLARHGSPHAIAPHKINYRANLWGLKSLGVNKIIAIAAVGGITANMYPTSLVIPNQIIDYTYGREHTLFADDNHAVQHIDFTNPYALKLRATILQAALQKNISVCEYATYACTQGPRLETSAEILRLERDGCDIVGMTGMPEAVLARELNLEYAAIAVVANWAAGKTTGDISMAGILHYLNIGMRAVKSLLEEIVKSNAA